MERAMPIGDLIFVAACVTAFATFAIVLAWTDFRTRHTGS